MSLLRNYRFTILWFVHFIATLAQELCSISVVVLVFSTTGSTLQATGVMIARTLPFLLFGPFAGTLVDRLPHRWIISACNLVRACLVVAAVFINMVGQLWVGYLFVFLLTLIELIHKPAMQACLPTIVEKQQIVRANSLIFTSTQIALTISYLIGGFLAEGARLPLLWLTCGLFLVASLSASQVRPYIAVLEAIQKSPFWRMAIEGFSYLRTHTMARTLITVEFLECWPHGVWTSALMLAFTQQVLHADTEAWGYQSSGFFAGQLLGAFVALAFIGRLSRRPGWVIIWNAVLMVVLTLAYGLSTTVLAATLFSVAFGPPFALRDVAQDALLQTTVAPNMLGRIYAAREMFSRAAFLCSGLFFAALADYLPIRWIFIIAAVLYGFTALYTFASVTLRQSRIDTSVSIST
jgi:MFS family permease